MALQNSTSAVWPSCGRCALILLPVTVTWERQTTIPPLATTQLIIDPNDNTTSTSIDCNSGILDQFYNFNDRGGPATLPWQTYDVDQNCNLIGGAQGALQPTGTQADRIPITQVPSPTGTYFQIGTYLSVTSGGIATTDDYGRSTCLTSWSSTITWSSPVPYAGPLYTDPRSTGPSYLTTWTFTSRGEETSSVVTSTFTAQDVYWRMPDLTDYLPGIAAVSQCTSILYLTDPNTLTEANYLTLEPSTKPSRSGAGVSTTTSPVSETTETATTAAPGTGVTAVDPSNTSTQGISSPATSPSNGASGTESSQEASPSPAVPITIEESSPDTSPLETPSTQASADASEESLIAPAGQTTDADPSPTTPSPDSSNTEPEAIPASLNPVSKTYNEPAEPSNALDILSEAAATFTSGPTARTDTTAAIGDAVASIIGLSSLGAMTPTAPTTAEVTSGSPTTDASSESDNDVIAAQGTSPGSSDNTAVAPMTAETASGSPAMGATAESAGGTEAGEGTGATLSGDITTISTTAETVSGSSATGATAESGGGAEFVEGTVAGSGANIATTTSTTFDSSATDQSTVEGNSAVIDGPTSGVGVANGTATTATTESDTTSTAPSTGSSSTPSEEAEESSGIAAADSAVVSFRKSTGSATWAASALAVLLATFQLLL